MTTTLNADRIILDWLADDRGSLDVERLDIALAATRSMRQRRGLRAMLVGSGSWPAHGTFRLSTLPPTLRIALALALATTLVAASLLAAGALLREQTVEVNNLNTVSGSWLAYGPDGMSFGFPSGSGAVLTLQLPVAGLRAFVQARSIANELLASTVVSASSDILVLSTIATVPVDRSHPLGDAVSVNGVLLENCLQGDVGRYRWALSPDGVELKLAAESDACDSRRAVFERTWLRSFDVTSRGGTAFVPGFHELLRVTLPAGDYEVTRLSSHFVARGTLAGGLPFTFFVMRSARDDLRTDCQEPSTPGEEIGLGRESIEALAQRRPALIGAFPEPRNDRSIGGMNAIHLTIVRGCPDDATVLWGTGDGPAWRVTQPDGQAASLWFIDRDSDLWVVGTLESTSLETYPDSNREGEVLDSIEWIPNPFFDEEPS